MAKIQMDKQRLGMAGEYSVCAELLKRGYNASITMGNAKAIQCFQVAGDGFADNYGEEKVFLRSPQALKNMIQEDTEKAHKMFANMDLDSYEKI